MTIADVLQSLACQSGKMPQVITNSGVVGQVTTIKDNGKHRGIGVQFPDLNYETWFNDSNDTDKRFRYMRDLSFYSNAEQGDVFCEKCKQSTFIIDHVRTGSLIYFKIDGNNELANKKYMKCKNCGHPLSEPVTLSENMVEIKFFPKNTI
jgi:hypothetical protein